VVAFVAAAIAVACGPGLVVRRGTLDTAVLARIEHDLAHVRGLAFTADVPGKILNDEEVAALLTRELEREFRPGELERFGRVQERLGFVPPGTDIAKVLGELYGDQLAALYDPRTKTLALTAGGLRQARPWTVRLLELVANRDLLGEALVAHELTHALQDQHYGLPTTSPPLTNAHGDRTIARRALLEGDASIAMLAYLRRGALDRGTIQAFVEQVSGTPEGLRARHPNVPEVIRTSLAFQYSAGTALVATAYLRDGWAAVDAAHRDPPVSSEQVLHPEKYFATRDAPRIVTLGGTTTLERQGWSRILEDTFGELDVRVLIGVANDQAHAADVAAGWDGDRCRVLERNGALTIIWLSVWDTEEDAVAFATAVPTAVRDSRVERRGTRVLVTIADDPAAVARRVWAESRISPEA
jgi:hypothetical protein